jgi:hypothetical protein
LSQKFCQSIFKIQKFPANTDVGDRQENLNQISIPILQLALVIYQQMLTGHKSFAVWSTENLGVIVSKIKLANWEYQHFPNTRGIQQWN